MKTARVCDDTTHAEICKTNQPGNNAGNMEPIRMLNLTKYAKDLIIMTMAVSVAAAVGVTAGFYKSVYCTTQACDYVDVQNEQEL